MKNFINNKKKRVYLAIGINPRYPKIKKKKKKNCCSNFSQPGYPLEISLSPQATYNREIYAFKRLERIFLFLISVPTLSRDPTRSFE